MILGVSWRPWSRIPEGGDFPTFHGACVYELLSHSSVTVVWPFHWPARWLWHAYQRSRAPTRSPRELAALWKIERDRALEENRRLREENAALGRFILNVRKGLMGKSHELP